MSATRRQFVALATCAGGLRGAHHEKSLFEAFELYHAALRVEDVEKSSAFYRELLGGPGIIWEKPRQRYVRTGQNFVAFFEQTPAALDHFAISVKGYDADAVEAACRNAKLTPRRSSSFVYIHDPNGIEVQIAHAEHEVHSPVVQDAPAEARFQGNGVHYVALHVQDVAVSVAFYQRVFGLAVVEQDAQHAHLAVGANYLALRKSLGPAGLARLGLSVEGFDAERAVATLGKAGIQSSAKRHGVHFLSPDGLPMSVCGKGAWEA